MLLGIMILVVFCLVSLIVNRIATGCHKRWLAELSGGCAILGGIPVICCLVFLL